jgi:3-oxoacyl-[acyl-carrier-protein] synthase II
MDQKRPEFDKEQLIEIKNRLARLGMSLLEAENRAPGEGGSSFDSQLDDLLADIVHKASPAANITTQPEPLLLGEEEPKPRRVVITGLGTVNPLAHNIEDFWNGLKKGQSGITRMTLTDPSNYPTHVAGEVKEWNPKEWMDPKDARRMSRSSQFAVAAARQAVKDAKLEVEGDMADEYGVVWGTGNCAYPETEAGVRTMLDKGGMKLSPFFIPIILPNMPTAQIAMQLGFKGYNSTIITACASSTQSIGEAAEVIKRGDAEVVISGGGEAPISELGLAGFCVMRAMSSARNEAPSTASRPFDKDRDGFVPSEGASALVLENLDHALARGARIYAEIVGFGATCDAYHLVAPEPSGLGAVRSMRRALHSAKLSPRDIDYINAHGTSTDLNDRMETVAVKKVFGDYAYQIPMSSTKSMIGHLLGGAGGVEAVATLLMMKNEMIHPTINYETQDDDLDLDYVPNRARPFKIKVAMSNSFGFGGQNASIIFKEYVANQPA